MGTTNVPYHADTIILKYARTNETEINVFVITWRHMGSKKPCLPYIVYLFPPNIYWKTVTAINSTWLVEYPIHHLFLNLSHSYHQYILKWFTISLISFHRL